MGVDLFEDAQKEGLAFAIAFAFAFVGHINAQ
jgi:hypothetical protein